MSVLRESESMIQAVLYCIDDFDVCQLVGQKARDGIRVELLLDAGQCSGPSCSGQLARLLELAEWGAEIRTLRAGPGFAVVHDKLWLVDASKVVTGSVNPTGNGFRNNVENMAVFTYLDAVVPVVEEFSTLFGRGVAVDPSTILSWMNLVTERRANAAESRARARASRSETRAGDAPWCK